MEGLMYTTLQDARGRRPSGKQDSRGEQGVNSEPALLLTRSISPLPPRGGPELSSRASTEATPRPSRHFAMNSLSSGGSQSSGATPTPSASALKRAVQSITGAAAEHAHNHVPHKFAAMLGSSSSRGAGVPVMQNSTPPPRTHSRSESAYPNNLTVNNNPNMPSTPAASLAATPNRTTKALPGGASPSGASVRGFDSGGFKPFGSSPALLVGSSSNTPGGTGGGSSGGQNVPSGSGSAGSDDPWRALCVHVLPLFNREPLRMAYEDLNGLVRKHIGVVLSRHPSKAIQHLETDLSNLLTSGMVTLNSKLSSGVEEEKLVLRVVELWGFFWDQVLPYVEAIFLPLQTDPYLASLNRGKTPRAQSPTHTDEHHGSIPLTAPGTHNIDVRHLALRAFRDSIVAPISPRLQARLSLPIKDRDASEVSDHHQPRLEQMLLVLSSIATQRYTHALSSSTSSNSQSSSERAVSTLLRLVLYPSATLTQQQLALNNGNHNITRLPSFLSGGGPRDRRGRVARKSLHLKVKALLEGTESGDKSPEDEIAKEREREREALLKSLKSPDIDKQPPTPFAIIPSETLPPPPGIPGIMVNQATPAQSHDVHAELEKHSDEDEDEEDGEEGEEDEEDENGDVDGGMEGGRYGNGGGDAEIDMSSMSSVGDVLNGGNGILGRAVAAGSGGDNMDTWEDAQAVVERMVGMRP